MTISTYSSNKRARRGTANVIVFLLSVCIGLAHEPLHIPVVGAIVAVGIVFLVAEVWVRRLPA